MRNLLCILLLLHAAAAWSAEKVTVRQDELRRVVESYVQTRSVSAGVQPVIKRLGGLADQVLPVGNIAYEVLAPQQWEGWGKTSLALIIRVNDQVVRNLPLQAEVEGWREVLVASRPLARGEILGRSDLAMARRNMATIQGVPLLAADEVVGKRLRLAIRQGAPLQGNQLEKVMLVTAGQQVTIVLEHEIMHLTATGRAKSAGAFGDVIQVQNLNSQKVFPARVVNAQTVQVDF